MAAKKRPTRRQPPKPSSASRMPQPPPSDALVYTEYDITDEPLDNRHIKRLPSQVQARIDELYELAQRDPMQVIPELECLIATYPHVPTFFNYELVASFRSRRSFSQWAKVEGNSVIRERCSQKNGGTPWQCMGRECV
jgi:hypothetical protein